MFSVDDLELNGQIFGASLPVPPPALSIPLGPLAPGGSQYLNGCLLVGNPLQLPVLDSTCILTTTGDPGTLATGGIISVLKVRGRGVPTDIMFGDPLGPIGMTVVGTNVIWTVANTTITGTVVGNGGLTWNGVKLFNGAETKNGAKAATGAETQAGAEARSGAKSDLSVRNTAGATTGATQVRQDAGIQTAQALAGKGFDIPHPTKKDHRLRYICLEGPEVGAYLRGTLKDSNVIELPDYWTKLVYPESITVNLTPVGHYQELFVEKIEWGSKIKIKNNASSAINCYYTIFAERITNDKLQVEYKGLTPDDYPGDNSEYALGGWDYARHRGEPKTSDL